MIVNFHDCGVLSRWPWCMPAPSSVPIIQALVGRWTWILPKFHESRETCQICHHHLAQRLLQCRFSVLFSLHESFLIAAVLYMVFLLLRIFSFHPLLCPANVYSSFSTELMCHLQEAFFDILPCPHPCPAVWGGCFSFALGTQYTVHSILFALLESCFYCARLQHPWEQGQSLFLYFQGLAESLLAKFDWTSWCFNCWAGWGLHGGDAAQRPKGKSRSCVRELIVPFQLSVFCSPVYSLQPWDNRACVSIWEMETLKLKEIEGFKWLAWVAELKLRFLFF